MNTLTSTLPAGLRQAQPIGATGSTTGNDQLGQASFLKLMTAQLKFQDPFDPVENQAMVAQMAQLATSSGIAEMNVALQQISAGFSTSRLSDASNLIGRSVLIEGNQATVDQSGSYRGEFGLTGPADNVAVEYRTSTGELVHRQELGAQNAGRVPFQFSPIDAQGNRLDLGSLRVSVSGAAANTLSTWRAVNGVEAIGSSGEPMLVTPQGSIPVSTALRVG